jgi:hypothetical protein
MYIFGHNYCTVYAENTGSKYLVEKYRAGVEITEKQILWHVLTNF